MNDEYVNRMIRLVNRPRDVENAHILRLKKENDSLKMQRIGLIVVVIFCAICIFFRG